MLTSYLPRMEVHSTCNNYNFPIFILAYIFADQVIRQSGIYTCPYPCNFTCQFSLPPPPTHNSFLLHHLCIQGGHLHSICQLSHLVLGLHLLKSNEKVMDHFSRINSNYSQSTGHCTCIVTVAISKPCAEDRCLQKPRIRFITT